LPWLGVEDGEKSREELGGILEELDLRVLRYREIEVKTSRNWKKFLIAEVAGFVEGLAGVVAQRLGRTSLESGEHLILGETSARLWDEAAKVVFPDGEEELVPIFRYDGFLDLRLPTERVRGLEGYISIEGRRYRLPLSFGDLVDIYSRSREGLDKVERAAGVYGVEKILSREAISKIRELGRRREEVKIEIDYETGFVFIVRGREIITKTIRDYVAELVGEGRLERAKEVYDRCPTELKEDIVERLKRTYYMLKDIGRSELLDRVEEFLKVKLGLELE